jgi:ankyrin repeat protein
VNAAPGHGYSMTALQAACEAGRKPVVELLLSHGANVNAPPTGAGHTALGGACSSGYADIVQLLLEHGAEVNPNIKPLSGKSVLTSAAQNGSIEIVELLIKHGVETNDPLALQMAVCRGRDDVARRLIELGADVNAAPAASHPWHRQRYTAIASASSLSMIKCLIAHGADINGPVYEDKGATAVQRAAAFSSADVLEELIRLGGNVNAPSAPIKGQTALEAAAYWGRHEHVRLLVEKYSAVINTPRDANWAGFTALEAAAFRAAKSLVEESEEPGSESAELESLSSVEFLLERGAEHTTSPLHMAAAWGNESLGELLLRKGANPNMPPNVRLSFSTTPAMSWGDDRDMGLTVFDTAQMNNRTEFLVFLENWCKTHSPHFLDTLSGTLKRMSIEESI